MLVCLRDGYDQINVFAATVRSCMIFQLAELGISSSGSALTLGQPVLALTLQRQALCRAATGVPSLKSLVICVI